jgi:hypothetical protein
MAVNRTEVSTDTRSRKCGDGACCLLFMSTIIESDVLVPLTFIKTTPNLTVGAALRCAPRNIEECPECKVKAPKMLG